MNIEFERMENIIDRCLIASIKSRICWRLCQKIVMLTIKGHELKGNLLNFYKKYMERDC
jgi:hypothetical protein